ncbi:hypothetical protein CGMCC3_g16300 [Colletotrichum fructicola]|uniref:Uncharacterized protein n=2 Tax=Colletotrichum gloeosporioides species complex TaxID=2707338 RepID=A0A7J6IFU8_COLFN|nr:uncharacterized protein CGMCC3_g16300 [Colletotrichum fructicola]KAE9567546.1 hypothetical protein CGMCC3_g16300 [Colletotrichum fructicola]KAF4475308.1 hypothetical protein CGGC5_v016324 [Colletotrichum fructicola Nara gc5]KAK1856489.1 hypothetical protein CCHR01_00868 [Colletotrichum chrysophilum]
MQSNHTTGSANIASVSSNNPNTTTETPQNTLERFLREPTEDGNKLVALPDATPSKSEAAEYYRRRASRKIKDLQI